MKPIGRRRRVVLLGAAVLCAAGLFLYGALKPSDPPMNWELVTVAAKNTLSSGKLALPAAAKEPEAAMPDDGLPHDKLFITPERKRYRSGDLTLVIPKLSIDAPVWSGTTDEDLKNGACLYEYAQLPGEGDRNVSLAAHRNGIKNGVPNDSALFYYVDTLGEGDYLYLSDESSIYRYVFDSTYVVDDTDWGPIYSQGFSCLTLTTCTPIGGATPYRLVVRGRLDGSFPFSEDFDYLPAQGS